VAVVGRPSADIGIVVDHSLSTRWKTPKAADGTGGEKTLYEHAVATVAAMTGTDVLKPNDTVSVVLAERVPRKLSPMLVNRDGVGPLLDALRKAKPGATRASIPDAVLAAREVIARGRNARKVIYVLSDGQRTNWEPTSLDKWAGAVGRRVKGVESNLTVYEVPLTAASGGGGAGAVAAATTQPVRTNLAVLDVKVEPKVIGRDRRATVTATVKNTGSAAVTKSGVGLWVNGRAVGPSQPQSALAPGESRTVRFDHEFTSLNSNAVEVRLETADGFDADNAAAASAFVLPAVPVLIVDGQGSGPPADASDLPALLRYKASAYLTSAMLADAKDVDAPAFLDPTVVSYVDAPRLRALAEGRMTRPRRSPDGVATQETLGLDSFAVVILNDVPRLEPTLQGKLLDYCRSGRGLWYILGPKTEPSFVRDQVVGGNLFKLKIEDQRAGGDKPAQVEVKDREHEVLRTFASAERNVLTGMNTLHWWKLTSQEGDATIPLATTDAGSGVDGAGASGVVTGIGTGPSGSPDAGKPSSTGDPLILERAVGSAGGRIVIWASPVDGVSGWNNWTTMKAFAPLVNLTVYQLAGGITKGQEARVESGKSLVWASPVLRDQSGSAGGRSSITSGSAGQQLVFPDGTESPPVQWAEAVGPGGAKARVRPVTRDGRQWAFFGDTFEPGKYEVRFDNPKLPPVYYGVGIDPAELDETTLTLDDRKWLSADDHKFVEKSVEPADVPATLATAAAGGTKGTDLWPWLATGLLAVLLGETFMTHRMVRRQSGPAAALGAVPAIVPAAA
jgi:archaellum component FlaF (FlaF/FlaG flagellin family)